MTERVLQPFSNDKTQFVCTHHEKSLSISRAGESQNLQAKGRQELRTFRIISKPPEVHNAEIHPIQ